MNKQQAIIYTIQSQGLMPLFFNADETVSIAVLKALYAAGVRIVEYTNRGATALQNFKALKHVVQHEMPDLYLGIGTIKDAAAATAFIEAGADFLISPALIDEVHEIAVQHAVLWLPGCMTVTEIVKAEKMGVSLVKLFPGNVLGPGFVSAIKAVFPTMLFMPTGGVDTTAANIQAWFNAGVCAVGMGSNLITASILAEQQYQQLQNEASKVLQIIQQIKLKD
ncbi:bifunctional 4-hydroxy-2-oxoglutarate aldolase/2-dehydro-3-deoxy-phosphogluconate aldolase [Ferruginibacter yonginensis]|uniref:Bifunctional 4-hydroxy-2-oxoglutarate aldolase/2-dehydro-3-deoxy-phosphogluconate aldolase n=1 Tax=Ferruginibacter yonginensis TaxID=1310416 RepID=A0ABV8QNT8_9BACT